jgi:hypothetical protein
MKHIAIFSQGSANRKSVSRFWRWSPRATGRVLFDGAKSVTLNQHMDESIERMSVDGLLIDLLAISQDFHVATIKEFESTVLDD